MLREINKQITGMLNAMEGMNSVENDRRSEDMETFPEIVTAQT
jgi:hypothetical protein